MTAADKIILEAGGRERLTMDENRQRIQELLNRIRAIVGDTLSNNKEIADIMRELESLGLKVNLNFIALVGGPQQLMPGMPFPLDPKDIPGLMQPEKSGVEFKITGGDVEFLKEIGISFDVTGSEGDKTAE